jgi:uncharacterized protein DUF5666
MAISLAEPYIRRKQKGSNSMQNITRLMILSVAAAVVGLVASATPVSAQAKEARGNVTAVTDSTITVKAGAQEMTFYVDKDTHLEVRRAAKEVQASQPGNPKPRVNAFFEAGNAVLVRYREENGRNHALNIERVGTAGGDSAKEPSKVAEGKVTSVSASTMTIASGGKDLTFAITGDTDVLARGASKATKAAGGTTQLTTFVHQGDEVSVSYKDAAGAMTASEIRVRVVNRK